MPAFAPSPTASLDDLPLAVVDVETTGLSPDAGDRVIEIGCVLARGARLEATWETLLDPERPLDPRAMAVNGITPAMVEGQPRFAAVAAQLEERLDGRVLVGHNAGFDVGFLAAEMRRAGRTWPAPPVLDTLTIARRAFRFARNGLARVAGELGVERGTAHRALGDALTTWRVFVAMTERLAARGVRGYAELVRARADAASPPEATAEDTRLVRTFAVAERVEIRYVTGGGYESTRVVRPVSCRPPYVVAYCESKRAERTFRLDRIAAARVISGSSEDEGGRG